MVRVIGLSRIFSIPLVMLVLAGCGIPGGSGALGIASNSSRASADIPLRLRLATTTSTADSGLLDAIVPDFERRYHAKVDVLAVGTGQALKLGENRDVDVVLVHARDKEDAFVAAGFGTSRRDVMYNDFVVVGPGADPAGVRSLAHASDAFRRIAGTQSAFFSRGDDSGTYLKERAIWAASGLSPTPEQGWYKSLGQGMGETLIAASEQQGYTLADRGTFLAMRSRLPELEILLGGETIAENKDKGLLNPYGVIPVNPAPQHAVNNELAEQFAAWITSAETQQAIRRFGRERFGQPLFYPSAEP